MTGQIALVVALTFIIHLVGTLSYSVRIVGARTGRIAVSFALFNILVLVSRTANSVQAPLLAKHVESNLATGASIAAAAPFRMIILGATAATLAGALLIPTFQRLFARAVLRFQTERSVARLMLHGFSRAGLRHLRDSLKLPSATNVSVLTTPGHAPLSVLLANCFAVALFTTGVLSSLYAGYLDPSLRATCVTLSGVINGLATLMMFLLIDPFLSVLTDDVVEGQVPEPHFRRIVIQIVGARVVGTVAAQLLFIPAAFLILFVARVL